jgi:hypothetical protein
LPRSPDCARTSLDQLCIASFPGAFVSLKWSLDKTKLFQILNKNKIKIRKTNLVATLSNKVLICFGDNLKWCRKYSHCKQNITILDSYSAHVLSTNGETTVSSSQLSNFVFRENVIYVLRDFVLKLCRHTDSNLFLHFLCGI